MDEITQMDDKCGVTHKSLEATGIIKAEGRGPGLRLVTQVLRNKYQNCS